MTLRDTYCQSSRVAGEQEINRSSYPTCHLHQLYQQQMFLSLCAPGMNSRRESLPPLFCTHKYSSEALLHVGIHVPQCVSESRLQSWIEHGTNEVTYSPPHWGPGPAWLNEGVQSAEDSHPAFPANGFGLFVTRSR